MDAAASHSILHMVNINRRSASQSLLPPGEYRPTTAHGAQGRVGRMRVRAGEVVPVLGGDAVALHGHDGGRHLGRGAAGRRGRGVRHVAVVAHAHAHAGACAHAGLVVVVVAVVLLGRIAGGTDHGGVPAQVVVLVVAGGVVASRLLMPGVCHAGFVDCSGHAGLVV